MSGPVNCWEFKKCGREPGGSKVTELGACPATVEGPADGTNEGRYGGRFCWAIAGTFCAGKVQGTFAERQLTCMSCDFFKLVRDEQGLEFRLAADGGVWSQR